MASLANAVPVGGYDCEFVEPPPSAFQVDCGICLSKLCDPQQVSCCGKNFCGSCIKRHQLHGQQCPMCNSPFTTFPNKGLKQSLNQLHVYCTHHSDGCEWTGEMGQLDQHLIGCQLVGAHIERLERLAAVNSVLIWLTIIASAVIIVFTIYAIESNVPYLQQQSHAIKLNVTIESNITALQEQYHAIKSKIESLQRHYHTIETNITSLQQQYCTIKTQLIHAFTPHEIPVCDSQPSQHVGDKEIITEPSVPDNSVLQSTVLFTIASTLVSLWLCFWCCSYAGSK